MLVPETEIIVSKDGAEILRKTVRPGDYVIGREPDCDVPVEAELVSRRHAQLTVNYDHALIADLGSSNGTFVNGQPVTDSTRLWPNQKIQIGAATIELHRIKTVPPPDASLSPHAAAVQRLLPEEFLRDKRYDIGKVVAQGGMGAILDAKETTIERRVAMKVMLDGSSSDDLTRFVTEAKITGQLEHPNVIPVHELSVDENGQPFYTMKLVRGITLRKVLELLAEGVPETVRKYSLPVLLTIFQKVCDALAFAHSKGVIHRDLKPENIMLDDFGVVLVMDWGLAKVIGHAEVGGSDVTRSAVRTLPPGDGGGTIAGAVMGTPRSMSPEQARGEVETLDVRSDIYALGAILYHLLALRPPVSGDDAWAIVAKVARGEIEPLVAAASDRRGGSRDSGLAGGRASRTSPGTKDHAPAAPVRKDGDGRRPPLQHLPGGRVPDSLAAVVRQAMAFAKEQRYPQVADLQRDIEAYQNGRATRAENAGLGKQLVLLVKRHKALFGTALAAWLIITALAVWFVINITRAKKQAEEERNVATHERDRAETTLTELRGTAPTFAAEAEALVEAGKFDEALGKLGYAIQLDPKNPGYQLRRARLLEASQHLAEAAAAYRAVLALEPGNRSAAQSLVLCERLDQENAGAPQLRRDLQQQLLDALLREGRAVEAGPLAAQLGANSPALEATIRARLKEYIAQPGWFNDRFRRLPNGTFEVNLEHLKLGNLSAFQGLPISELNLATTDLQDLRPLAGLPLTALNVGGTSVTDLSPIRSLKLERFYCIGGPLADLEPLRGMPLRVLDVTGTQVTDLSVLAGMPLEDLHLVNLTIKSLAPLRGLPLRHLDLRQTQGDTDMAAIAECHELEDISLSSYAANIEALRALPKLAQLRLEKSYDTFVPAKQFWAEFKPGMEAIGTIRLALKKAGLTLGTNGFLNREVDGTVQVGLGNIPITDLEFLRGLPVSRLYLYSTKVQDLTPLSGLPLKYLNAANTPVADLEPLRGLPLIEVDLYNTKVTSVSPLLDCPTLEGILLSRTARDLEVLRRLPKLRLISFAQDHQTQLPNKTAEQFWKEYDAQHPAGKK